MPSNKRGLWLAVSVAGMVLCASGLALLIYYHLHVSSAGSDLEQTSSGKTEHPQEQPFVAAGATLPSGESRQVPSASAQQPSESVQAKPVNATTVKPISEDSLAAVVAERVQSLKEAHLGSRKIVEQLNFLARKSDEISIRMLLALSEDPELGTRAIRALGYTRTPAMQARVANDMRMKLSAANADTVSAAAMTYAVLEKNAAISDLQTLIVQNWMRSDGRGLQVCAATVQGLESMATPEAEQALRNQLLRVNEPGWLPDYGSIVVAALAKKDRNADGISGRADIRSNQTKTLSNETIMALKRYASALTGKMPGADNPPGRKYYEDKIAEIRAILPKEESVGQSTTSSPGQTP